MNGHTNGHTNGTSAYDVEKFKRLFFTPVIPFNQDDTVDWDSYRLFIRRFSEYQ